ncbi:hypothetical protein C0J52_19054 [Blattella germanica]|nr:hypothetical protein C0J52_19054 [Blattella germanica]
MSTKIAFLSERFIANFTLKWTIRCMSKHMCRQTIFSRKRFTANITLKWTIRCVNNHMSIKIIFSSERFIANFTLKWAIGSLRLQKLRKIFIRRCRNALKVLGWDNTIRSSKSFRITFSTR